MSLCRVFPASALIQRRQNIRRCGKKRAAHKAHGINQQNLPPLPISSPSLLDLLSRLPPLLPGDSILFAWPWLTLTSTQKKLDGNYFWTLTDPTWTVYKLPGSAWHGRSVDLSFLSLIDNGFPIERNILRPRRRRLLQVYAVHTNAEELEER